MRNRLQQYQSARNTALDNKTDIITDAKFLKRTGDTSKPASNKIILDDIEAIQKNNQLIDQFGAPQTNFAPFGNKLAAESSTTANAEPSESPPRTNPLHDFEPVNYIISLSCISDTAFNNPGEGEELLIDCVEPYW